MNRLVDSNRPPATWLSWCLLGAAVLAGGLVRGLGFDQSLFGDELYTHAVVHGAAFGDLYDRIVASENTPPLYYVLAWAGAHVGDDTVWLRLPSLLAGIAAIPLAWALGRRLAGDWAAAIAGWLVALNPFLVYFSIEARAYMLAVALTLGAVLLLLRALRENDWLAWSLFGLAACAALYTHIICAFVMAAVVVWALWTSPQRWKGLVASSGGALLLYLPWVPSILDQGRGTGQFKLKGLSLLSPMGLNDILEQPAHAVTGTPFAALANVPGGAGWLALFGVLVALALLLIAWRRRNAELRTKVMGLIAVCVAAPLIVSLLYGAVTPYSIWFSRNLILFVPFLLVLLGAGIALGPRAVGAAALVMLTVPFVIADVQQLTDTARPDQRAVADFIRRNARPGDEVVLSPILNTPGPLRNDTRVYLSDLPTKIASAQGTQPRLPGGAATPDPTQRLIVTGVYSLGTPITPTVSGRQLLTQQAFPGLYKVFVRIYGPRET